MNLQNDDDDYRRSGIRLPSVILAASASIFVILAVVLVANGAGSKKHTYTPVTETDTVSEESETVEEEDKLTASDLDFWDMYKGGNSADDNSGLSRKEELEMKAESMQDETDDGEGPDGEMPEDEEEDPSQDGKHVQVTHSDGTTEWLTVNSSLKLNSYEDTDFQTSNGIVGYYVNGKKTTKTGVDISQYTTEVGWSTLAKEVDFVMIRAGARGYDSGKLITDTKFVENVCNAIEYNIPFGVYFSSQAVTEDEAKEEAAYTISQITAAQTAVAAINSQKASSSTSNTSSSSTSGTSSNVTVTSNVVSTATNYVMGLPAVNSYVVKTAEDNDGNTTYVYADSTAVTKKASGEVVTAYSDGSMITNYSDGSVVKKDNSGNTISIDSKGNYTVTNSNGATTASGTTSQTTGLALSAAGTGTISAPTTNTTSSASTGQNSALSAVNMGNFTISYPVAIDLHLVDNDSSRTDSLSSVDRTAIAKAYCTAIQAAGYTPMVYGDKEMLLTKLNLSALSSYDIWLYNEGTLPEYPYLMNMWKYDTSDKLIKSLSGEYGVDTCFVDYAER